ncbi:uncharacterized protein [Dysidea avara]|uniref:uncharacterized protein isoform X2 n=1 Tax=Dysidea avara TaxID=196820 RepID=UPI00331DDE77
MELCHSPASVWSSPVATIPEKKGNNAVKSGLVYFPTKVLFRRVIHKYYCELHRETNFYPRQLVLFEIPKYNGSTEQSEKVAELIPLDKVFRVEALTDKKCMFKIMTSDKQYQIRVDTFQEASDWVDAINNEIIGQPVPGVVYEYRVKVPCKQFEVGNSKGSLCNSYLLKVYDDKIKLFTANGKIPCKFSCDIKNIYNVKYQPKEKQCRNHLFNFDERDYLTFSINNAKSHYQEKDILTLQAISTIDLIRVVCHRKRLTVEKSSEGNMISSPSNKSVDEPFQESIRSNHFCTKRSVEQCPGGWNSESVSSFSTNESVINGIGSHHAKPIPMPRKKLGPFNEGRISKSVRSICDFENGSTQSYKFNDLKAEVEAKLSPRRNPLLALSLSCNASLGDHSRVNSSNSSLNSTDCEADFRTPDITSVSSSEHTHDFLSQLQKNLLERVQCCSSSSSGDMPLKKQYSKSVENICEAKSNLANQSTIFHSLSNVSALKPPPLPRPRHKIPQMIPFSPGYSLTDKPPCYSSAPEINIANENNCTMFRIDGFSPRAPDQHINSAVKEKTKPSLVTDSVMSQQKYVPFLHCKSASLTELLPTNDLYDDLQPLPPKGNTVGTVRTAHIYDEIDDDDDDDDGIYDDIDDDDDGIYDDIDDNDDDEGYVIKYLAKEHYLKLLPDTENTYELDDNNSIYSQVL